MKKKGKLAIQRTARPLCAQYHESQLHTSMVAETSAIHQGLMVSRGPHGRKCMLIVEGKEGGRRLNTKQSDNTEAALKRNKASQAKSGDIESRYWAGFFCFAGR